MPSLKDYKVEASAFSRYYHLFLLNSFHDEKYRITLRTGESAIGTPTAGSFVRPDDPDVSFLLYMEDGVYKIPFAELLAAEKVSG